MNLYDQLLGLQVIEDAYLEWRTYRKQLTDFIIQEAKGNESIAILGAGRCNDIDLKRILAYFNEVTLVDKDKKAMEEGICKQEIVNLNQIKIRQMDFIGMSEEDYRVYADILIKEVRKLGMNTNVHELAKVALKALEWLEEKVEKINIDLGRARYETTVVVGVHSQLLSMLEWIWHIILQTIKQDESCVRAQIIRMNEKYIRRFNDLLIGATKKRMIIGCEKERIGRSGSIQGAVQSMDDLNRRMRCGEISLLNETQLEWEFNKKQGIVYLVDCQSIEVKR